MDINGVRSLTYGLNEKFGKKRIYDENNPEFYLANIEYCEEADKMFVVLKKEVK